MNHNGLISESMGNLDDPEFSSRKTIYEFCFMHESPLYFFSRIGKKPHLIFFFVSYLFNHLPPYLRSRFLRCDHSDLDWRYQHYLGHFHQLDACRSSEQHAGECLYNF